MNAELTNTRELALKQQLIDKVNRCGWSVYIKRIKYRKFSVSAYFKCKPEYKLEVISNSPIACLNLLRKEIKKFNENTSGCVGLTRLYGPIPTVDVLPHVGKDNKMSFGSPYQVSLNSYRLLTYKEKGTICVKCGLVGTFFAIECAGQDKEHLNIYGYNTDGKQIMMTVDHIYPKSKGGSNDVSNLQPMCSICNSAKADKIE